MVKKLKDLNPKIIFQEKNSRDHPNSECFFQEDKIEKLALALNKMLRKSGSPNLKLFYQGQEMNFDMTVKDYGIKDFQFVKYLYENDNNN